MPPSTKPSDREALRRSFLPTAVSVLFVGESPPAGGTFFYAADSGLYRATRDAFAAEFASCRDGDFLRRFAALGCYLDDLCREPVNRLIETQRSAARRAGEPRLSATLATLRPRVIVVVMKAIAPNVARAAARAGVARIERHVLTYPGRWHRTRLAYVAELRALLRDLTRRGVLYC